jgi:hypothetical protein
LAGASWVQREILEASPAASLRVFVLWVPFLGADRASANLSQQVFGSDPRVLHYWDGSALTSRWFANNVEHSSFPAWDVYYLYGPDASWQTIPQPLVSTGATVIGQSSALQDAIEPLLARECMTNGD